jgi:hypothetical protein
LIEPMTNQPAVVTFSRSPRMAVAFSIHGVASKTYDLSRLIKIDDSNSAD